MSGTSESQFRSVIHEGGCGKEIARVIDGVLHVDDLRQDCKTWVPLRDWVEVDKLSQLLEGLRTGRLNIDQILGLVKTFQPEVLDAVRACGGQFESARLTTVPGGDLLESQRDNKVSKFRTDWHFKPLNKGAKLTVTPSIASEVIYLPKLVEGSLGCTYDKMDGGNKPTVTDILDSLPKVEGLRWIIGNTPTVNRVLANRLQKTDGQKYLLRGVYTWLTDTYESTEYGLRRLIVGSFDPHGVNVDSLRPFWSDDVVGVFALGVPA